jgi:hypothetical protein
MKYYKKEHTIKLILTNLFPMRVNNELIMEMKAYNESQGFDYNKKEEEEDEKQKEEFLRNKNLLMQFAPNNLKSVIESAESLTLKSLPDSDICEFDNWRYSIFREIDNCFYEYNNYIRNIIKLLPVGFQKLTEMSFHDSKIISKYVEGANLKINIMDVQKDCYVLEFINVEKFEYEHKNNDNIWKQDEILLLENGFVEYSILTDVPCICPVIEAINEIKIVASDIKISKLVPKK